MEELLEIAALANLNENDLEDAILYNILHHGLEGQGNRAQLFGRFNLDNISEEEAWLKFRFQKVDIPRLVLGLGIPENIITPSGYTCTGIEGICIVLRRLAYPNRWTDLEQLFGRSNKALSSIGNYVMDIIYGNNGQLLSDLGELHWLNQNKITSYSYAVAARGSPIPNCWGFIDGTARAICRPTVDQETYYSGHKRFHALKYQSVVAPDGIIINLQGPYPGRRHDAAILRESGFYNQLERHAVFPDGTQFILYGDSAYGVRELLLTPFPNTQHVVDAEERRAQEGFNYQMSLVRQCVEWGFAKVLRDFAFLDFKKNQKLLMQNLEVMYKVGVLLTNCLTCLYGSETSQYFRIQPPILEEYLGNI